MLIIIIIIIKCDMLYYMIYCPGLLPRSQAECRANERQDCPWGRAPIITITTIIITTIIIIIIIIIITSTTIVILIIITTTTTTTATIYSCKDVITTNICADHPGQSPDHQGHFWAHPGVESYTSPVK